MRVTSPASDTSAVQSDLALTALRFAAGELSPAEASQFAARIAADQEARDALEEAYRLSAAVLGQPVPAPAPGVRQQLCDRLSFDPLVRLFPRRLYRGHPLAWAMVGGLLAAALTVFGVWLGDPPRTALAIHDWRSEPPLPAIPPNFSLVSGAAATPDRPPEVIVCVEPVGPMLYVERQPSAPSEASEPAELATETPLLTRSESATDAEPSDTRPTEMKAVIGNENSLPGQ